MKKQPIEILDGISSDIRRAVPKEAARDALSIVLDAINSINIGLIITDIEGIIRFVNPAFSKIFEYASEEIIGKNAADLFATKEVRTLSDVITMIDINTQGVQEFVVKDKDKNTFIVEVSASVVRSSSGLPEGKMASFSDITKRKEVELDREKLIGKLQDALCKIKTLKGLIPICASCKKIRDDKGYWNLIENYIQEHSDARFSHGICPECSDTMYGNEDWYIDLKNRIATDK